MLNAWGNMRYRTHDFIIMLRWCLDCLLLFGFLPLSHLQVPILSLGPSDFLLINWIRQCHHPFCMAISKWPQSFLWVVFIKEVARPRWPEAGQNRNQTSLENQARNWGALSRNQQGSRCWQQSIILDINFALIEPGDDQRFWLLLVSPKNSGNRSFLNPGSMA